MKRVCLIGNSYLGALRKALDSGLVNSEGYRFDFVASPGKEFRKLDIRDGKFLNAYISTLSDEFRIDSSVYYVVYSSLPSPQLLSEPLGESRYSRQVREAAASDRIRMSAAFKFYEKLKRATSSPIIVLPGNPHLNSRKISVDTYIWASDCLRRELGESYHPLPNELYGEGFVPQPKYHEGSIDIASSAVDARRRPSHMNDHMNEKGAALVFNSLVDRIASMTSA
jgi:hypothetical protein